MKMIKSKVYLYAWLYEDGKTGEQSAQFALCESSSMDSVGYILIDEVDVEASLPEGRDFKAELIAAKNKKAMDAIMALQASIV